MIRWLAALALAGLLIGPAHPLVLAPTGAVGCSPATAFIGRTSGENTAALTSLICGLVTAGLIDNNASMLSTGGNPYCGSTGKYDRLYIFTMTNQASSILDICGHSSLDDTHGSAFIPGTGWYGSEGSPSIYLDTGFTPSTNGVHYTLDTAHGALWILDNTNIRPEGWDQMGALSYNGVTYDRVELEVNFDGTNSRFFVNTQTASLAPFTGTNGYFVINRSASNAQQVYRNGTSFLSNTIASVALPSVSVYITNRNFNGGSDQGSGAGLGMVSLGGSLSSGDVTATNSLFCAYFTAVHGSC